MQIVIWWAVIYVCLRGGGGQLQKKLVQGKTSKKKNHAKVQPLRKMIALAKKKKICNPKATKKKNPAQKTELPTPFPGVLMVHP